MGSFVRIGLLRFAYRQGAVRLGCRVQLLVNLLHAPCAGLLRASLPKTACQTANRFALSKQKLDCCTLRVIGIRSLGNRFYKLPPICVDYIPTQLTR